MVWQAASAELHQRAEFLAVKAALAALPVHILVHRHGKRRAQHIVARHARAEGQLRLGLRIEHGEQLIQSPAHLRAQHAGISHKAHDLKARRYGIELPVHGEGVQNILKEIRP